MSHNHDDIKFAQLYNTHKPALLRQAYDIIKDAGDAEDIVQIAMLKTMKILDNIDSIDSPETKALLYTIVRNTAIDCYRKRKKEAMLSFDDYLSNSCVTVISPEDIYFNNTYYRNIAQTIEEMPEIYQDVLRLRCLRGLSSKETADLLGTSEPAINTRLLRARKLLVKLLEDK